MPMQSSEGSPAGSPMTGQTPLNPTRRSHTPQPHVYGNQRVCQFGPVTSKRHQLEPEQEMQNDWETQSCAPRQLTHHWRDHLWPGSGISSHRHDSDRASARRSRPRHTRTRPAETSYQNMPTGSPSAPDRWPNRKHAWSKATYCKNHSRVFRLDTGEITLGTSMRKQRAGGD